MFFQKKESSFKLKGFTFIELLLVIAIIGLLSAIIIVSVMNTRDNARDSRIMEEMNQFRNMAEVIKDTDGDYDCVCDTDTPPAGCSICNSEIRILRADINTLTSRTDLTIYRNSNDGASDYCAEVEFNNGDWFCVDSILTIKKYSVDPNCSGSNFSCD